MSEYMLRALCSLMPDADISLIAAQPWYSLALAGTQVSFKATVSGHDHVAIASELARKLDEQDFDMPGGLVADVAVSGSIEDDGRTHLVIDVLLLDD